MNDLSQAPVAGQYQGNPVIVAGQHGGRPVYCSQAIYPRYLELKKAADAGNRSAHIAIHELKALTTGHVTRENIYVKPVELRARDIDEFYAILPGIKATVVYKSKGEYQITNLELDASYFQTTETHRPGLYRATKSQRSWQVDYIESGEIKASQDRAVSISDSTYSDATEAARTCAKYAVKAPGIPEGSRFDRDGFDLHYTPDRGALGGLTRYDALKNVKSYDSALLLAHTMMQAHSVEDVNWVSIFGGSAVLTQALEIVASKGRKLEGHSIYLYRPRTSPKQTIKLASKLSMRIDKKSSDIGFFDPMGAASHLAVARHRINNHNDPYSVGSLVGDIVKGSVHSLGIAGAGAGLATTTVYAAGIPALITLIKGAGWATAGTVASGIANHALEPHGHKVKRLVTGKK